MTASSSSEAFTSTNSTDATTFFRNPSMLPQPFGQIVAPDPLPLAFANPAFPIRLRSPETCVVLAVLREDVRATAWPDEDGEAALHVKIYFVGRPFILRGLRRRPLPAFVTFFAVRCALGHQEKRLHLSYSKLTSSICARCSLPLY